MKEGKLQLQGGFSRDVASTDTFADYAREVIADGFCGGWIGSQFRTIAADKAMEKALRENGLGDEGVALWLTSSAARHSADAIERGMKPPALKELAKRNARNAFEKVTIWSHPDHTGMKASTNELTAKIRHAFKD